MGRSAQVARQETKNTRRAGRSTVRWVGEIEGCAVYRIIRSIGLTHGVGVPPPLNPSGIVYLEVNELCKLQQFASSTVNPDLAGLAAWHAPA